MMFQEQHIDFCGAGSVPATFKSADMTDYGSLIQIREGLMFCSFVMVPKIVVPAKNRTFIL